jgi:hypothetical protein
LDCGTNGDTNTYCCHLEVYRRFKHAFPTSNRAISIHFDAASGDQWDLPVFDHIYYQMAAQQAQEGPSSSEMRGWQDPEGFFINPPKIPTFFGKYSWFCTGQQHLISFSGTPFQGESKNEF